MSAYWQEIWRDAADFVFPRGGPGTELSRSHSWPFSPSLTIVLLAAAAAWVVFLYARESGSMGRWAKAVLCSLRIALIALVLFMMYGWMLHRHRTDLPDLVLMLDDSQSMSLEDLYENPQERSQLAQRLRGLGLDKLSRLNLGKLLLLEDDARLLRELRTRYNLKVYRLAGSARQLETGDAAELPAALAEIEAGEPTSRLGTGLRDVLEAQRGRPTAAVLLLTDGVTTEGKTLSDVAEYARRKSIPLLLVGVGNDKPPRDLRISDVLVDEAVFVGDLLNFDLRLSGSGFAGRRVAVRLKIAGSDGPILAEKMVRVGKDAEPKSLRLSHRPENEGDFNYSVEVEVLEGESNTENNRQTRLVKVRDETLRVLYVQDYPSYEFRFLKNALGRALKRDGREKAIRLTTVLQEADLEYAATDATAQRVFPVSRDDLFAYDVLLFGDVNPSFLSRTVMDNIVAFVEQRGGGVVFIAGPRYMPLSYRDSPLAKLLPVDLDTATLPPPGVLLDQPIHVQPTKLISASPQMQLGTTLADSLRIWREMPPLYWLLHAPDLRPAARVLAVDPAQSGVGGDNLPVVAMQFVGAGKVIFHASDESFRWSRHPDGERYFELYWTQTIRYLSRSKLLAGTRAAELTTDRVEYRRGEAVRLRVRFFDDRLAPEHDDGVRVVLERQAGPRRQIVLRRDDANRGTFEGLVSNLGEGDYRAWVATPTLSGEAPSQRFTVVAPPGELARLQMDAAELQLAAKVSQGRFYTIRNAAELLQQLPQGRQVRIDSLPPKPIWNSPLWAALFVVLITAEWLLRKRAGLL